MCYDRQVARCEADRPEVTDGIGRYIRNRCKILRLKRRRDMSKSAYTVDMLWLLTCFGWLMCVMVRMGRLLYYGIHIPCVTCLPLSWAW